jgi:predicted esterase YcpF (UPF0227 family)
MLDKCKYELHTLDYNPEDPEGAVKSIKSYAREHKIKLIIGSSLGGFLTLHLYGYMRIVINPCWNPAVELPLIGYTGPTEVYAKMLQEIIDTTDEEEEMLCCGCFAKGDELLGEKYRATFSKYYRYVYDIPGGHHVTREAVEKIVNEVIPDLDAETDDYVRKLIGADNLPMWED